MSAENLVATTSSQTNSHAIVHNPMLGNNRSFSRSDRVQELDEEDDDNYDLDGSSRRNNIGTSTDAENAESSPRINASSPGRTGNAEQYLNLGEILRSVMRAGDSREQDDVDKMLKLNKIIRRQGGNPTKGGSDLYSCGDY